MILKLWHTKTFQGLYRLGQFQRNYCQDLQLMVPILKLIYLTTCLLSRPHISLSLTISFFYWTKKGIIYQFRLVAPGYKTIWGPKGQ